MAQETKKFVYEICVVGAGMIGSASARHASLMHKGSVCLIGPEEPLSRHDAQLFGAYYDEARIFRSTATDYNWGQLARASIARYESIEKESGITFHETVGCLSIGPKGSEYVKNTYEHAVSQGGKVQKMSAEAISRVFFPYLGFSPDDDGIKEEADSGYLNPRKLVLAEQIIAQKNSCDIVRDIVSYVKEISDIQHGEKIMQVITDSGKIILAKKVLLATGAFTTCRELMPNGMVPEAYPTTQTVLFAELCRDDLEIMRNMPSICIHGSNLLQLQNEKGGCYILPPVKYPDGKYYIKIGHGNQYDRYLSSDESVGAWYRNPPPEQVVAGLKSMLHLVFPGLKPISYHTDTCCTYHTPDKQPYIDLVTPRLGVAIGGCGYAAKSCDEIGRIASKLLLTGEWKSQLPREKFKLRIRNLTTKL